MITRLSLTNWKTHKHSEFTFDKGTNVLLGVMGAGKSSVVNGISFALFGTFPDLRQRRVKLEDILTSKPYKATEASVELGLSLDGKDYTIKRTIKNGKTDTSELRLNGDLVEGPATNKVNEAVERLIGLDYDLFSKAVYAEQNEVDYFLKIPRGERKKRIDELLDLERFEKAKTGVQGLISKASSKREEAGKWLDAMKVKFKEEDAKTLQTEVKDTKAELEVGETTKAELARELAEARKSLIEMEGKRKESETARNEIIKLKALMGHLQAEIDDAEKALGFIADDPQAIEQKKNAMEFEYNDLKAKSHALEELSVEKEGLAASKNLLENDAIQLERELGSLKELLPAEAEKRVGQARTLTAQAKDKLIFARNGASELGQKYSELKALHDSKKRELKELEEKSTHYILLKQKEKKFQENHPEIERACEKLKEKLSSLELELKTLQRRNGEEESALEDLEKAESNCPVCETILEAGKKHSLAAQKREKITFLGQEIKSLNAETANTSLELQGKETLSKELKALQEQLMDFKGFEQRIEKLKGETSLLEEDYHKAEAHFLEKKKEEGTLEKEVEELEHAKTEIEAAARRASSLADKRRHLKEVNDRLRKAMNEFEKLRGAYSDEKMRQLEEAHKRLEAAERVVKRKQQVKITKENLSELERRVEKTDFKEETFTSLKERESETGKRAVETKLKADYLKKILTEKEARLKDLEKVLTEVEASKKSVKRMEDLQAELTIFKNALTATQTGLRENFITSTNQAIEQLWPNTYPYEDYTSARLGIQDGDYVLQLMEKGSKNWKDVEVIASGGERSAAALTLRLAFSLILAQKLTWIILDEPTHNLDARGLEKMSKLFRDSLPGLIDQVFIITHEERLKTAGGGSVHYLNRNKNVEEWAVIEKVA